MMIGTLPRSRTVRLDAGSLVRIARDLGAWKFTNEDALLTAVAEFKREAGQQCVLREQEPAYCASLKWSFRDYGLSAVSLVLGTGVITGLTDFTEHSTRNNHGSASTARQPTRQPDSPHQICNSNAFLRPSPPSRHFERLAIRARPSPARQASEATFEPGPIRRPRPSRLCNAEKSTGFTRCSSKPASSAVCRSPRWP